MAISPVANSSPKPPRFTPRFQTSPPTIRLANGDATLRDFRATLLGGEVTAQGTMKNIGGDSRSKFDAALHGISLAKREAHDGLGRLHRSCRNRRHTQRDCDGHMGKDLRRSPSRTQTRQSTPIWSVHNTRRSPQLRRPTSQASRVPSLESPVPIESALHATYTRKSQQLALDHSYFRTPQTNLNLNGTVSKNSSLASSAPGQRSARSRVDCRSLPHTRTGPADASAWPCRYGLLQRSRSRLNLRAASHRSAHRSESSTPRLIVETGSHKYRCKSFESEPATCGTRSSRARSPYAQRQRSIAANGRFSKSSPVLASAQRIAA